MKASQVSMLQIAVALLTLIFCAYVGGRVHQWYQRSWERDEAFKEGYNHASEFLFPLAARNMSQAPAPPSAEEELTARRIARSPIAEVGMRTTRLFKARNGRH